MNESLKNAKISVVMCTHNGQPFLAQQLDSILNQSFPVHEIVIHDDVSTDGTIQILNRYASRFPELIRFHLNQKNLGTIKNIEHALHQCTGDIVFLSDQDDLWRPDKVAKMIAFFRKNPDTLLLFTDGRLIDATNQALDSTLWEKWRFTLMMQKRWKINMLAFQDILANHNRVTGATVAMRRQLLKNILPIETPKDYWHDAWLALHAAAQNGLRYLPECLIDYRIHDAQQVGVGVNCNERAECNLHRKSSEDFYNELKACYPDMFKTNGLWYRVLNKLRMAY